MRILMRPIALTVTPIVFLLAAAAVVDGAEDPSKPFSKVTIDINTAGIEETLPFDIPFYFTGTVDDAIKRVDLHLIERGRSASLLCAGGRTVADMVWQRRQAPPAATPGATPFQVFEPRPLNANQNYCLNITIVRSVAEDVVKKFKSDGTVRVDTFLRTVEPLTEILVDQAEGLRQELIGVIADPATGDRLVALPGSIFRNDSRMTPQERDAVTRKFRGFLAGALQAQDNKFPQIDNLEQSRANAMSALQRWAGPTSFYRQMLDKLEAAAQTDQALEALLAPHRKELHDLALLTGTPLRAAAAGEASNGTSIALKDVWDTTEIDGRATRVNALLASIDQAAKLIGQLQSPRFNTAGNLSPAERGQLGLLAAAIADTQPELQGSPIR
jgi:hypothetical protein